MSILRIWHQHKKGIITNNQLQRVLFIHNSWLHRFKYLLNDYGVQEGKQHFLFLGGPDDNEGPQWCVKPFLRVISQGGMRCYKPCTRFCSHCKKSHSGIYGEIHSQSWANTWSYIYIYLNIYTYTYRFIDSYIYIYSYGAFTHGLITGCWGQGRAFDQFSSLEAPSTWWWIKHRLEMLQLRNQPVEK